MRLIVLVLALIGFQMSGCRVAHAQGDAETSARMRRDCERLWPDDFAMLEYCMRQQAEALARLAPLLNPIEGTDEHKMMKRCMRLWMPDNKRGDWGMVEFCYKEQDEARKRLKGG